MSPTSALGRQLALVVRTTRRWRPDWKWVLGVIRSFVVSFLALTVTLWLLPGQQVAQGAESVAALVIAVLLLGAVLRPFLIRLTVLTGSVGLLVAGVLTQALILGLALNLVPTVQPFPLGEIVVASWAATAVAAAIGWLFDASSDEAFFGQVLGQAVRLNQRHGRAGPGLLVVQLDGVSEPLLRQAITAGAMPTVSTWLRRGSHDLRGWHTGLPATTPAGQCALLHGDVTSVPSFRWYDKVSGRLVVTSQPSDVAAVEQKLSNGRGLLAEGGVSVSNLFSGDAPQRILTMSDARLPSSERGAASFAVARFGFARSLVLFVGQMIAEWHQGRRQRRRDVRPRVRRSGVFVLQRGLTTVVLRDLNVSLVSEHMARGAPVIFVDFVDYDEVAHHAGPSRPESIRTLEGLDRVLRFFAELSSEMRADYEIAVVSDHGQTQGTTFRQLTGHTLSDLVHELAAQPPATQEDDRPVETWGPANVLFTGTIRSDRLVGRAVRRVSGRRREADTEIGRRARGQVPDHLVVAASGSLAHIYLTDEPGRTPLETVERRFPRLVDGLRTHPQIGLVLVRRGDGTLVALGGDGSRDLDETSAVTGTDPTLVYGPHAAADLRELDRRDHVGDLVVLGAFRPALSEVVAFEELVGSHGGLGGWQTDALLIHPVEWDVPTRDGLNGLDVHQLLVRRLERLGLRREEAG